MHLARWVDRVEMELVNRGEAYFHVGGAGHEASAAIVQHLTPEDWLHPHYRDKALMLARGIPPEQFFHGLLCTAGSTSGGRQMGAHLSYPEVKVMAMAGPVGNNALPSVGVAQELVARATAERGARNGDHPAREPGPLVLCVNGDSTTQQGEFLEAIGEAVRCRLPVLFLIEDNGYGISTRTAGRTFYSLPSGPAAEFLGIPIRRLDGRDAIEVGRALGPIVASVRRREPAVVVLEVERLTHHTNADDERVYRDEAELKRVRSHADPVERLRGRLLASGVAEAELDRLDREAEVEVRAAAERALAAPNPPTNLDARPPAAVDAVAPPAVPPSVTTVLPAVAGSYTMLEAMREVLRRHLASDGRVSLYGEDIEDPKGDVFGLTRGLTRAFPGQVRNSPLTESTIVGVSLGRALAGGRPVACIQFADFLPMAYNQIACELGSIHWRSGGGWSCPVIILAPGGAYRPGLGPFHAHTFESVMAHVPGIDVVTPSSAADAAGLLNAAFANQGTGRPTVFLYPKVCLNDPALAAPEGALGEILQPGVARTLTRGDELTMVSWGSTVPLCLRAARLLEEAGVGVELLDLRSISPWDRAGVAASVRRTGRLVVVHEDNLTCGFGAEVVAGVTEELEGAVRVRRVTRFDTYPPCNYLNQMEVLPSLRRILEAVADLCALDLRWEGGAAAADGAYVLEAVGSSPADQSVSVVEWKVAEGASIEAGDPIADCEADKATFELRAPVSGVIHDLLPLDEKVPIGSPMARIVRRAVGPALPKRVPTELRPVITRRAGAPAPGERPRAVPLRSSERSVVGISVIAPRPAGRVVTNEELVRRFEGRTPHDILQRTGIESRPLLGPGETALTLATRAAREALRAGGLTLHDLDAIYVSTSTPISVSPSMACLLHHQLGGEGAKKDLAASDILAACTGYLYALQTAFDFCQSRPDANILVVTAEAMSEYTNPDDFDTAIVFADAATATLVHGPASAKFGGSRVRLHRPVLSARGEDGTILHHGRRGDPNVNMDGLKVFPMAVRQLIALLKEACAESEIGVEQLDHIVPHQANGRILDAVDQRLKLPRGRLINRVKHAGNTSSSTIPLVLAELLREGAHGRVGLCAFGAGFTFGAAVMELQRE
ncbi:MAG: transketolase [Verrucomicrobiae bacterium]|nr:transketolase [Verrucomicrobiae bacterium]